MLIKNIHLENSVECTDIRVLDGVFEKIESGIDALPGEEVIDGTGCMILPPFIESHVHLDTCLTAGDPVWNMSGTLFEGIECWSQRQEKLTKQDVKDRAGRAIRMQAANGVQFVRTHVDVTDPTLVAMEAMLELREELKDEITVQIVAFPQEGILSYPNGKELLENAVKMGADCVGAIPHFEFTREYSVESLNFAMDLAYRYDRLVDVHCDEIDDEASRGLETLAARAYEMEMFDKVTASHTTAMHSYNNAYVNRLMRLLKMSRINFVANPLVNTHLQGRVDTYPKRRGVTRVKELLEAGLNGKRAALKTSLTDYLENHMAVRLSVLDETESLINGEVPAPRAEKGRKQASVNAAEIAEVSAPVKKERVKGIPIQEKSLAEEQLEEQVFTKNQEKELEELLKEFFA